MGNKPSSFNTDALRQIAAANMQRVREQQQQMQCNIRQSIASQTKNAFEKAQNEFENCNPQQALSRKLAAASAVSESYIQTKRGELGGVLEEYNRQVSIANRISEAEEPVKRYVKSLKDELAQLRHADQEYERAQRKHRRSFLDAGPSDGVGGVPGIRTYDDKVMLAFWATYVFAIVSTIVVLYKFYGIDISDKKNIAVLVAVLLVAVGLAFTGFYYYG
jgi:hypothetical protein